MLASFIRVYFRNRKPKKRKKIGVSAKAKKKVQDRPSRSSTKSQEQNDLVSSGNLELSHVLSGLRNKEDDAPLVVKWDEAVFLESQPVCQPKVVVTERSMCEEYVAAYRVKMEQEALRE